MFILGVVPGLPFMPFAMLGGLMAFVGVAIPQQIAREAAAEAVHSAVYVSSALFGSPRLLAKRGARKHIIRIHWARLLRVKSFAKSGLWRESQAHPPVAPHRLCLAPPRTVAEREFRRA